MKRYEKLLDRAYSAIPATTLERTRFEPPRPVLRSSGSRTVIENLDKISKELDRDPKHILTFMLKELGTAGSFDGTRAVLHGQFTRESISKVFERYVGDFVICPICKRPDTRITREKRLQFLLCEACGAKSSLGYLR
ncbi:MAG: translation initiation factor IF-2 subunit beta [Candidatus Bathyarchaeia archaeon]